jgi:hypothetical protein
VANSNDWAQLAGTAASAYFSGGASLAGGSSGGGGSVKGDRFAPVTIATGWGKIAANFAPAPGDVLPGVNAAAPLFIDDNGIRIGSQPIPWVYVAGVLVVAWLVARRKRAS